MAEGGAAAAAANPGEFSFKAQALVLKVSRGGDLEVGGKGRGTHTQLRSGDAGGIGEPGYRAALPLNSRTL